ncbi:MAG: aminodeoxychorismate/anthranilate synthase component II [Flammeovirgaceae bacterium]|nr:aminodeoxychorismate/anthranilate synthase component II [Flammeovirgaceae bacterium]
MKILVLDNYDSFTYNLVYQLHELSYSPSVIRNDKIELDEVKQFDKILLSPGPGMPDEAGIMKNLIQTYGSSKSILGVCLGHQAIAEVYHAQLYNMDEVLHGVTSKVILQHDEKLFQGIPKTVNVCHYHSWSVKPETIDGELKITATNERGLVMGIAHTEFDVRGVQFHPESILTEYGKQMISNWIRA